MDGDGDLELIGFGSGLELTIAAEMLLRRRGFVFSLNAPSDLVRHLNGRGVEVQALDGMLETEASWADRLVKVADFVLREMELDPPVALLVPDNPLFLNPLSRFLVSECASRQKKVSTMAGVSQFDTIINTLGLNVGRRGLGLIDAVECIETWPMPTTAPVLVFKVAVLIEAGRLSELADRLRGTYSADHPITLVNVGIGTSATSHATLPLCQFEEFEAKMGLGACLYIGPAG